MSDPGSAPERHRLTCSCGRRVMRSATPRLVTAIRSRQRSCSSRRPRSGGSPASVTWVLLSDSFFNLQRGGGGVSAPAVSDQTPRGCRPGHGGEVGHALVCDLRVVGQVQL